MHKTQALPSSFRDPAGFLFTEDGVLYRQVNKEGVSDYRHLMDSGLYQALVDRELLVEHTEADSPGPVDGNILLLPRMLPYISYPYEWCFEQLKDAALLTLEIQRLALDHGMTLKDASAYNIQFDGPRAAFIDTLSFEKYQEGRPWAAYRQFCQHFLAPLALGARCDVRLGKLLLAYIDGIPLDLTSQLLPKTSWLSYSLLAHIHLHAIAQKTYSRSGAKDRATSKAAALSSNQMRALLQSLEAAVQKQQWRPPRTEWGNYYNETNYTDSATSSKEGVVTRYLQSIPEPIKLVQDLGANNGHYSRLAAKHAQLVVSQDIDPIAVSANYRIAQESAVRNLLPLELDLVAPPPGIGWDNRERDSFSQRQPADVVMALALVHHLAISNNLPLERLAEFFANRGDWLIIEFVPKSDSQVEILLGTRTDIFPGYNEENFEHVFGQFFEIREKQDVEGSKRSLYLLKKL